MKKLITILGVVLAMTAAACGGGGGQDVVDAIGQDVPGEIIQDVAPDTAVNDTADVREDVINPTDVVPDTTPDVITDTVPDEIEPPDAKTEIPETCECMEHADCNGEFDDLGPCEYAACHDCACVRAQVAVDESCDDGNSCTTGEKCDADGVCGGGANNCPCSGDADCDRYNDDDLCNGVFKCNLLLATPACEIPADTVVHCEDTMGLFCRTVGCDPDTGSCIDVNLHEGEACPDTVACTTNDKCVDGVCTGTPDDAACADDEVCTTDYCDALQGCVYVNNDEPCSDGNACTEDDTCNNGTCQPGTERVCDDGIFCTIDSCDESLGCVVVNAVDLACDDMDPCTTASTCDSGNCVPLAEGCCDDTNDNDLDTLTDCDDPDCIGACPVAMFECALVSPASFTGAAGATFDIRASVTKAGITDRTTGFDGHPYLRVQYAVGPENTLANDLPGLAWMDAVADAATDDASSDFWTGTVTVPALTDPSLRRDYMVRVSGDQGDTWSYCDMDGTFNGYDYNQAGKITIKPPYQLLFSEYMEGSSNNKAVEVFNASQYPAYLGDCVIRSYFNGASTPTSPITLSNVDLPAGGTFNVCGNQISTAFGNREFCDMLTADLKFNGDDAIELVCGEAVQDIFGVIGVRPNNNWGSGMTATKDHTLRRDCSVQSGTGKDVTEWDESKWIGFPVDTWQGFDSRLCDDTCVFNERETCCKDSLDNDRDGMLDCDDFTCKVLPECFVPVDWCQYAQPAYVRGSAGMTGIALAWVYAAGKTDVTAGQDFPAGVVAQFGYGPGGTLPDDNWLWNDAPAADMNSSPRPDADTYRRYYMVPNVPEGFYDMAFRVSADGGYSWTLCDLNGSDDGFTSDQAGKAEVVAAPNVFFSEYVDGTGNDKAVEIFNNSGRTLDLHNCGIGIYADGAAGVSYSFWLEDGLLPVGETWVVCKDTASAQLAPYCDELRSLLDFNGNDTILLECESKVQDVIGQRGFDPGAAGWGAGDVTTAAHTLRRDCAVAIGDQLDSDAFDPAAQWMGFPVDIFLGLGSMQCGDPCADGGIESCCDDDIDNDLDGVDDCLDEDCSEALECQPVLVDLAMLEMPLTLDFEYGGDSTNVFARVFVNGITSAVGQGSGIIGQAGWGPDGSNPDNNADWVWIGATYFGDVDISDDMYTAIFTDTVVGTWDFAFRFTADDGGHWLYADAIPNGSTDGYSAANAGSMTVYAGTELLCDDGVDNDGDIDIDCDDTDCAGSAACMESANCYDGIDNDGDTFTDCDDTDCASQCVEAGRCDDTMDNDQDTFVDCDDSDCDSDPACFVPVDWCRMFASSPVLSHPGPYFAVKAWVREAGMTDLTEYNDNPAGLTVMVGWGAATTDPATWTWAAAEPFPLNESSDLDADTYYRNIQVPDMPLGNYEFAVRASADGGQSWLYCDLDGSDNDFDQANQAGKMTITTPPKMLFTEYVEGTGENKAVEITNLSGRDVMLNMCSISGYNNGATTFAYSFNLDRSGLFLADSTIVICDDGADASLAAYCSGNSGLLSFNGNDTLVLECEDMTMDVFGQVGVNPGDAGWGSGDIVTVDRTLRRNCGVTAGDTNPDDAFDPAAEWFAFPTDTYFDLLAWTCGDSCYVGDAETCCGDTLDNDFDGLSDCDDDDCFLNPACIPENETDCTDTIDEDMDGVTDCADADCIAEPTCPVESDCANGTDDDGDGLTDCADYNCDTNLACPAKVLFSEYGEGSGTGNKWLEVWYYGTGTRDLTECTIYLYTNGSPTSGSSVALLQNAATANDVWTVCHTSITGTPPCDQKNAAINHNGDDGYTLACGGVTRDSIGQVGVDPGSYWGVSPITTADHTLCRSPRIPDVNFGDTYDPTVQWVSYPQDFKDGMDVLACP